MVRTYSIRFLKWLVIILPLLAIFGMPIVSVQSGTQSHRPNTVEKSLSDTELEIGSNDWVNPRSFNLSMPALIQAYPSIENITYIMLPHQTQICTYGFFESQPLESRFFITDYTGYLYSLGFQFDRVVFENITQRYEWDHLILSLDEFEDGEANQWLFVASLSGGGIPNPYFQYLDRQCNMTVGVDLTSPSIEIEQIGPISEAETVTINVTDLHCNIKRVTIQVDDGDQYPYTGFDEKSTSIAFPVTIASLSEGTHNLTVIAIDEVDNESDPVIMTFQVQRELTNTTTWSTPIVTTTPTTNDTPDTWNITIIYNSITSPTSLMVYIFGGLNVFTKSSKTYLAGIKRNETDKVFRLVAVVSAGLFFISLLFSIFSPLDSLLQSLAAGAAIVGVVADIREFLIARKEKTGKDKVLPDIKFE